MSQLETRFTLDNTGFIQRMIENGTVTEREAARMNKSLKYVSDQMKVMQAASKSANDAGAGIKESSAHMEEFGFKTVAAKRELLVLAHELSQGNFKKFGGSIMVLGEQTGAAGMLFSGMGISALAATAAVGAFAAAAVLGAMHSEALRKSLILTGNAAGINEGQFNAMADAVSKKMVVSVGKTREAIQALISTGEVGAGLMQPMTQAVVQFAKLSGETEEKVAVDFAKMAEAPTKWAEEHNKATNFVTMSQYEYIKHLEEIGKKEEAAGMVLEAMNKHLETTATFWDKLKLATSQAWDAMLGNGRPETVIEKLETVRKKIEGLAKSAPTNAFARLEFDAARQLQGELQESQRMENRSVALQAQNAAYAKAGIAASDYFTKLDHERKGVNRLTKDLEELNAKIAARVSAGGPASLPEDAEREKFIRHRDRSEGDKEAEAAAKHLAAYIKERLILYSQETAKLAEQQAEYVKYGKVLDKTALAMAQIDVTTGKAAKASAGMKAAILAAASAEDSQARETNEAKATAAVEKRIRAIGAATEAVAMNARQVKIADEIEKMRSEGIVEGTALYARLAASITAATNSEFDRKGTVEAEKRSKAIAAMADAQELNARQTKIAIELNELESGNLVKGTALYDQAAKARTAAVNAEFDGKLKLKLASQQLTNDDEVHKLDAETAALGMGTLARINAAHASKLYAQAQIEIAANPGMTAQILDAMISKTNQLTEAELRHYAAKRRFETGAHDAFQKYQESAGDASAFAEKVVTGSFTRMEDALVNFTKTGKLNFGSMFEFMADEFIRQQIRMQIAAATSGSGGGGLAGLLGSMASSYFSGNSGAATSVANSLPGDSLNNLISLTGGYGTVKPSGVKLATGTNYVPYDGMQATLHKGEAVVPAIYNPAAGGQGRSSSPVILNVINNGAPVRAQSTQRETHEGTIVDLVLDIVNADVSGGGRVHDTFARRFGLNPGGSTPRY